MAKTLAKAFIILTLLFEVITLLGLASFYPVLGVAAAVTFIAIIIYHFIKRFDKKRYITVNIKKTVVA